MLRWTLPRQPPISTVTQPATILFGGPIASSKVSPIRAGGRLLTMTVAEPSITTPGPCGGTGDGDRAARRAGRCRPRRSQSGLVGRHGSGEHDRLPLQQEARPQRKTLGASASVLQVHHMHPAGLLDPHDCAAPAGLDFLDHQTGLSRDLRRGGTTRHTGGVGEHVAAIAAVAVHPGRVCRVRAAPGWTRRRTDVDLALARRECQQRCPAPSRRLGPA